MSRSDGQTRRNWDIGSGVVSHISVGAYCGYDVRASLNGRGDSVTCGRSLLPVDGFLVRIAAWWPKSDVEVRLSGQTGS